MLLARSNVQQFPLSLPTIHRAGLPVFGVPQITRPSPADSRPSAAARRGGHGRRTGEFNAFVKRKKWLDHIDAIAVNIARGSQRRCHRVMMMLLLLLLPSLALEMTTSPILSNSLQIRRHPSIPNKRFDDAMTNPGLVVGAVSRLAMALLIEKRGLVQFVNNFSFNSPFVSFCCGLF
jgi:hypothetical protein